MGLLDVGVDQAVGKVHDAVSVGAMVGEGMGVGVSPGGRVANDTGTVLVGMMAVGVLRGASPLQPASRHAARTRMTCDFIG